MKITPCGCAELFLIAKFVSVNRTTTKTEKAKKCEQSSSSAVTRSTAGR